MHEIKKPRRNMFVAIVVIALALLGGLQTIPLTNGENGLAQPPPQLQPDVKITSITFSNNNPGEDEEITISATVWNNNTMNITNVTITFSYDITTIENITNLSIGAKENMTINVTWKAVKWNHNISVMVSIDGMPLKDSMMSKEITVNAKPIGDVLSLVIALMIVFIIITGTITIPGIWKYITNKKCK